MNQLIEKSYAVQTLGDLLKTYGGTDPNKGLDSLTGFIWAIIKIGLDLGGMFAVIMFLWGAFQYVTAYGSEEAAKKAKNTIIWAVAGIALLALANVNVLIPMLKK